MKRMMMTLMMMIIIVIETWCKHYCSLISTQSYDMTNFTSTHGALWLQVVHNNNTVLILQPYLNTRCSVTAGCPQQQHCVLTIAVSQHTVLCDCRLSTITTLCYDYSFTPNTRCSTTAGCPQQQHCVMTTALPPTHSALWLQVVLNNNIVLWL